MIRIRPDSALVLPAGRHHQIVKSGDAPLRLLAAFPRTPVQTLLPDRVPIATCRGARNRQRATPISVRTKGTVTAASSVDSSMLVATGPSIVLNSRAIR